MHNAVLSGGFGMICSNYLYLTTEAAAWRRGETIRAESEKSLQFECRVKRISFTEGSDERAASTVCSSHPITLFLAF